MENVFTFLQQVVLDMNAAPNDEALLELVIDKCVAYTGATSGTLMIISPDNHLDIRVYRGFAETVKRNYRLAVGEGITGWVAQQGEPYICQDTEHDPHYLQIKGSIRSEIAVPMRTLGKVIGVINLDSRRKHAFSEHHADTLMIMASSAALIYNKITTIESLQLKVLYQEILLDVAERLSGAGTLTEKFAAIMDILQERLAMERGTIVLQRGSDDEYAIHTAVGLPDEAIRKGVYRRGEGITGRILASGESIAIRDIHNEPAFLNRTRVRRGDRRREQPLSFIGVPIRIHDNVVGVLSVDKPFEGKKFDEDISLLRILASLLGQALQVEELSSRERDRLRQENAQLKEEVQSHYSFDRLVGISPPMLDIYRRIELVSNSETTVLITGESGTGKELVADAIHARSNRSVAPLVKINCAAIPESLLESELFGYKKGAFTGAASDKPGRVLAAHGGTLFLDEIGDMALSMQTKLLRMIQNKEVDLIGGTRPQAVDVRIIAATSRDLEKMIRDGLFREDLYYRLNVFRISIPPLRERREDIELIARHYLKTLAEREKVEYAGISYDALAALTALPLEGNVRQLQNFLEQAFLVAGKGRIEVRHLNLPVAERPPQTAVTGLENVFDATNPGEFQGDRGTIYRNVVGEVERKLIDWALRQSEGNRSEAARLLGINRNTLNTKLRETGRANI